MKKYGLLNSSINSVLAKLGHTDTIVIADCGLPIPDGPRRIDLAITPGFPSFQKILSVIYKELVVESCVLAHEIQNHNQAQLQFIQSLIGDTTIEFVSHERFKTYTASTKAVIRTGEASPYSNIILRSGVIF